MYLLNGSNGYGSRGGTLKFEGTGSVKGIESCKIMFLVTCLDTFAVGCVI